MLNNTSNAKKLIQITRICKVFIKKSSYFRVWNNCPFVC